MSNAMIFGALACLAVAVYFAIKTYIGKRDHVDWDASTETPESNPAPQEDLSGGPKPTK